MGRHYLQHRSRPKHLLSEGFYRCRDRHKQIVSTLSTSSITFFRHTQVKTSQTSLCMADRNVKHHSSESRCQNSISVTPSRTSFRLTLPTTQRAPLNERKKTHNNTNRHACIVTRSTAYSKFVFINLFGLTDRC